MLTVTEKKTGNIVVAYNTNLFEYKNLNKTEKTFTWNFIVKVFIHLLFQENNQAIHQNSLQILSTSHNPLPFRHFHIAISYFGSYWDQAQALTEIYSSLFAIFWAEIPCFYPFLIFLIKPLDIIIPFWYNSIIPFWDTT